MRKLEKCCVINCTSNVLPPVLLCRFGRVQSVKLLNKHHGRFSSSSSDGSSPGEGGESASVSFMDITSACKAHGVEHRLDDRVLRSDFYDPASGGHGSATSANGAGGGGAAGSAAVSSAASSVTSAQDKQQAIQGRLHG